MAHARQVSTISQRRHMAFASSIWRRAGPVFPIGKNSSGFSSRQAARLRQFIMIGLLETRSGDQRPVSQSSRLIGGVTGPHKSNFKVKALVKAQVNARLMRASSQGSRSK